MHFTTYPNRTIRGVCILQQPSQTTETPANLLSHAERNTKSIEIHPLYYNKIKTFINIFIRKRLIH